MPRTVEAVLTFHAPADSHSCDRDTVLSTLSGANPGTGPTSRAAELCADLLNSALDLYDPALPYHNANHAVHVTTLAQQFSHAAHASGVEHDGGVVLAAAILHDAGYGHHHAAADAEAHSADLATRLLAQHGWAPERAGAVAAAIAATRLDPGPASVEGMLVRAADLWEMGAPWPVFAANRTLLRLEAQDLDAVTFDEQRWRERVARIVGGYADGPMWLPQLTADATVSDVEAWRARVHENLVRHAQS